MSTILLIILVLLFPIAVKMANLYSWCIHEIRSE